MSSIAKSTGSPDRQTVIGALLVGALTAYGIAARRRGQRAGAGRSGAAEPDSHGHDAGTPSDIPRRGWWDILLRVKDSVSDKNLSLVAAGAGFYLLLAIPAAFTALISLYGLVADTAGVQRQVEGMRGILPAEAITLLSSQLATLASHANSTLGVGLAASLGLALWSARSGTASMIAALNIAYEEPEKRSFVWFQFIALSLTLGTILGAIVALGLVAVLPAIIDLLPLGGFGKLLASIARWPILMILVMGGLAAFYRFAPSRREPQWRWVSWGAVVATLLWIAASALFSLYVSEFASYDQTYGSIGGVVVLLMWLYLSCFVVLLGAAINAEIEHQTRRDSTVGGTRPMGQRGARMADTVGRSH
jgi:membrane protein